MVALLTHKENKAADYYEISYDYLGGYFERNVDPPSPEALKAHEEEMIKHAIKKVHETTDKLK